MIESRICDDERKLIRKEFREQVHAAVSDYRKDEKILKKHIIVYFE